MKINLSLILCFLCTVSFGQLSNYNTITSKDLGLDYEFIREIGTSVNSAGDFNGDGNEDIVFSARLDNSGISDEFGGGFWIGLMDGSGILDSAIYIQQQLRTYFDESIALDRLMVDNLGDLDGNGVNDFILGVPGVYFSEEESGVLATVFMEADGSIKDLVQMEQSAFGLSSVIAFGSKTKVIGDINKDGILDVGVSLRNFETNDNEKKGAILIAYMSETGLASEWKLIVNDYVRANGGYWGFGAGLEGADLNEDGNIDLIIGSPHSINSENFDGFVEGTVVVAYLNENADVIGSVILDQNVLMSEESFFTNDSHLGESICLAGDLNGDGISELIISLGWTQYGTYHGGFLLVVSLNKDGKVLNFAPVFDPLLEEVDLIYEDHLGDFTDVLQDYNGDGFPDIITAVQQSYDDGEGNGQIRLLQTDYSYFFDEDYFISAMDEIEQLNISISPNPSSDFINVNWESFKEMEYSIFNSSGSLIVTGRVQNLGETQINIQNYKEGIYWLQLVSESRNTWRPFVKQ